MSSEEDNMLAARIQQKWQKIRFANALKQVRLVKRYVQPVAPKNILESKKIKRNVIKQQVIKRPVIQRLAKQKPVVNQNPVIIENNVVVKKEAKSVAKQNNEVVKKDEKAVAKEKLVFSRKPVVIQETGGQQYKIVVKKETKSSIATQNNVVVEKTIAKQNNVVVKEEPTDLTNEDEDVMFLLSLLSEFKKVPSENKLKVKADMISVILNSQTLEENKVPGQFEVQYIDVLR